MKCPHCAGTGELAPTVGALVKLTRIDRGMTQEQLALASVLTRAHIANIETDRTDVPVKTLQQIAVGLGVSAKDLLP